MKTSFITALLAAAALLAGCSKDAPDGGPQPSDGNRVVFTLGGATRAAGDNDASAPLAATDEEKKIDGLLAVAFTDDGNYYKTFDAAYDADSQTASFDVEKNGTYDIWFVANADETLAAALLALTDRNSDSRVTEDDLAALLVTQQVGRKDGEEAWHPFVMFSTEARRIVSKHGVVTNGGVVTMRRLAVRIDLVNAATGVTVNSVKFVNRTKQSRLGASNDMTFSTPQDLYEEKSYEGIDLAGDFAKPTEYKASIYSYENVDVTPDGEHLPALEVKYTMDGLKFTHTVKFFDSTDPAGKTPLALKRNYLYRIVLTKQLDVSFDITVEDWNTAGAFQIEDIPFDKHDQAALNAQGQYVHRIQRQERGFEFENGQRVLRQAGRFGGRMPDRLLFHLHGVEGCRSDGRRCGLHRSRRQEIPPADRGRAESAAAHVDGARPEGANQPC